MLRGGASNEYEVSLKTGASILKNLDERTYIPVDILIDKRGEWHIRGVPTLPERALTGIDAVWIALHGEAGECGEVQRLLHAHSIPYTGAGPYASAACYNKELSKAVLAPHGVRMPRERVLAVSDRLEDDMRDTFRSFAQPSVVKPVCSGSSVGVSIARDFETFRTAVKGAFQHSARVLVEEHIKGREATVGVVEGLRGESLYLLPPVEIVPPSACSFFDYTAKYSGKSEERCPGNFSSAEVRELQRLARLAHEALGLRHYSRSDFIVSPDGVYYLETNSAPACGMTEESLLPKSLAAVGVSLPEFIDHVSQMALARYSSK